MTYKKKKPNNKRTKKQHSKKRVLKNRLFIAIIFMLSIFFAYGYHIYAKGNQKKIEQNISSNTIKNSTKELMEKMKKMLETQAKKIKTKKIKSAKTDKKSRLSKQKQTKTEDFSKKKLEAKSRAKEIKQNNFSEIHDYQESLKYTKNIPKVNNTTIKYSGKPKLAIIIDDVSFASQVKMIKKIPFKVTPSFFPPTTVHPNTVHLSHEFSFAMVHLPLEAISYAHSEADTLLANDTKKTIENRIKQIHSQFPNITYYNNHTGSKFTSNLKAMQKLIKILHKYKIHFVDSRTTSDTKAGIVSKNLHLRLLSRDVFLDNVAKSKNIIEQLKRAVKIAERKGYAIAIGHPHKNTMDTLKGAKKYLKGVKLVYINAL